MGRPLTVSTPAFAVALLALTFPACEKLSSSPDAATKPEVPIEKMRYPHDYTEYEDTVVPNDNVGPLILARGKVLKPGGHPSPFTLVTLDQSFRQEPNRCVVTKSDAEGNYVVRGEKYNKSINMIWAATADGKLGCSWTGSQPRASKPVDIQLRGGETVLHVRNEKCEPIADASVTVYMSGIDDLSEIVPRNIRQLLTKTTDKNGIVRFPSRLGDHELGFDVRARGYRPLARDFYSGLQPERLKLFILGVDQDASVACSRHFLKEKFPRSDNTWLVNAGRPDHF